MQPLRLGLIGAGTVARTLHAPLLRQFRDVSIAWVYDANGERARSLAALAGGVPAYDDLERCPDVDAALIAIPVGARDLAWQAAAARRWHVLCEKPAALTTRQLDSILGRMEEAGRTVMFGFMRRFYAGVSCLRDLVARRVFGDPIEIWAGEGGPQPRTGRGIGWYQLDRRLAGGGVLIETGSHLIDEVLFVASATAATLEQYEQRAWHDGLEFDARLQGQVRMPQGAIVPFGCVVTRSTDVCNGVFVRYPQMVLALPPGPDALVELRDREGRITARVVGVGPSTQTSFHAFRDQWAAFIRACRSGNGAHPREDNCLTRLSVQLIEECYGRAVPATAPDVPVQSC